MMLFWYATAMAAPIQQLMLLNTKGDIMKKKKKLIKVVVILLVTAIVAGTVFIWKSHKAKAAAAAATAENTATVEKRSISSQLSSSGTLEAKDTYSITSMVEGEVVSANFEEGDQVEKDQVLYEIDRSSMDTDLNSAQNSVTRSQTSYADARETELIPVGSTAVLTLVDSGEQIEGTVKAVANREETLSGGRLVKYVTITVNNPGGLTTSTVASAQIGEFVGSEEGTFKASTDTTMNADLAVSVEVEELLVHEGDYVTKGTPIFRMTSRTAEKLMRNYKDALDKAQESVESAQSKLESTQDSYDNYTITAPISGQVITKNFKVGDNITKNTSSTTTLATIYDLSALTFKMSIDELDIQSVKVGQNVTVTADAFEGQTFSGTVTNVSLESTYSNGVSTYPVTVTMDEVGDLLPGMNVDGVITLEEANDVLTIPVDALMRGNQVYIKDDSVKEQQGPVPAGFKAVEVETGLTNDSYVEIKSGLSEGDTVYVAKSSTGSTNSFMGGPGMGGPGGGMGGPPSGGGNGGGNRGGNGGGPR